MLQCKLPSTKFDQSTKELVASLTIGKICRWTYNYLTYWERVTYWILTQCWNLLDIVYNIQQHSKQAVRNHENKCLWRLKLFKSLMSRQVTLTEHVLRFSTLNDFRLQLTILVWLAWTTLTRTHLFLYVGTIYII